MVAGPTEATAIGNVLMQAMGAGRLSGLAEARELVRRSFPMETYQPKYGADWDRAYARYQALTTAASLHQSAPQ